MVGSAKAQAHPAIHPGYIQINNVRKAVGFLSISQGKSYTG
jgi:hypothetical protein